MQGSAATSPSGHLAMQESLNQVPTRHPGHAWGNVPVSLASRRITPAGIGAWCGAEDLGLWTFPFPAGWQHLPTLPTVCPVVVTSWPVCLELLPLSMLQPYELS